MICISLLSILPFIVGVTLAFFIGQVVIPYILNIIIDRKIARKTRKYNTLIGSQQIGYSKIERMTRR